MLNVVEFLFLQTVMDLKPSRSKLHRWILLSSKSFLWHILNSSADNSFCKYENFVDFPNKRKMNHFLAFLSQRKYFLQRLTSDIIVPLKSSPWILIIFNELDLKVTCVSALIQDSSPLFAITSYLLQLSLTSVNSRFYNPRIDRVSSMLILCIVDKFWDFFKAANVSCFSHFFCLA